MIKEMYSAMPLLGYGNALHLGRGQTEISGGKSKATFTLFHTKGGGAKRYTQTFLLQFFNYNFHQFFK